MTQNLYEMLSDEIVHDESNMKLTENGALGYESTGKHLLDMTFSASALRGAKPEEIMEKFEKAYYQDPEHAVKWVFFAGALRDMDNKQTGMGERNIFDSCLKWLEINKPEILCDVIPLIPQYTRWSHVMPFVVSKNKDVAKAATTLVTDQLKKDLDSKHPSLAAKWLPSIQTKKKGQIAIVRKIEKEMGWSHKDYRKSLSAIRSKLNLQERLETAMGSKDKSEAEAAKEQLAALMSEGKTTAHNNLKNERLAGKDEDLKAALDEQVQKAEKGEISLHGDKLYPYEILAQYLNSCQSTGSMYGYRSWYNRFVTENPLYEQMWKELPYSPEETKPTIVVRDGSGSMTASIPRNDSVTALDVATALAIYFAEHQPEGMKDKFITFGESPKLVDMSNCNSFAEKVNMAMKEADCSNTNIEATFDLLLKTLKKNHVSPENAPQNILIVSDMQFDDARDSYADEGTDKALFEQLQERYEKAGYKMPRLVFWNVEADPESVVIPVIENDMGVCLVSGYSITNANMVMSGELDPIKALYKELDSASYEPVGKAIEKDIFVNKSVEEQKGEAFDLYASLKGEEIQ